MELLTELLERKNRAFLTFWNLGSVYVSFDKYNVFPTRKLKKEERDKLEELIKNDAVLGNCRVSRAEKVTAHNILHLHAPLECAELVRKNAEQNSLYNKFVTDHTLDKMRWSLGIPGWYFELSPGIKELLEQKKEANKKIKESLDALAQGITAEMVSKGLSERTAKIAYNKLLAFFGDENTSREALKKYASEDRVLKVLKNEQLRLAFDICDELNAFVKSAQKMQDCSARFNPKEECIDLFAGSLDYFRPVRAMTRDELMSHKFCFLDIETPLYRQNDFTVSWAGLKFKEGSNEKREIHTLRNCGAEKVDGYAVVMHESEEDLVNAVSNLVLRENPLVFVVYNANFDLMKLREADGEFKPGERGTGPVVESVTKMFERIGIRGRIVLDLLSEARTDFAYLVNKKLDTVARHLLGSGKAGLRHIELYEKELEAISGNKASAQEIGSYLARDVDLLAELFAHKHFQNVLDDACFFSQNYGVMLSRYFHSPNAVNYPQEKSYFRNVGTFREEVFELGKHMREEARKAFNSFNGFVEMLFGNARKEGLHANLYKCFVPTGDYLCELLKGENVPRFPEISLFFKHKYQYLDDWQRQFSLSQRAHGFSKYIITDFMQIFNIQQKEFAGLEKKLGIERKDTTRLYALLRHDLETTSEWALTHLDKGTLSQKAMKKHLGAEIANKLKDIASAQDISEDDVMSSFYELMKAKAKLGKRERAFWGNYATNPSRVQEILEKKAEYVNNFISKKGWEIVYVKNRYVYVKGPSCFDDFKGSKIIPCCKIDKALVADKIYYEQYGFISGIDETDEKDDYDFSNTMTRFEMKMLAEFFSDLFAGRYADALSSIYLAMDCLNSEKVSRNDLVYYSKASNLYSAFQNGEKIYFRPPEIMPEESTELIYGKERKVFSMKIEDLNPDFGMYAKKISARVMTILAPLIGSKTASSIVGSKEVPYETLKELGDDILKKYCC